MCISQVMGGVGPGPIKIPVGGYTVKSIPQAEVIGCVGGKSLEIGGEVERSGLSWGTLYGIGLKCMASSVGIFTDLG